MASDVCLHCRLVETVEAYYREVGDQHGDNFLIDMVEALDALGQVCAEFIASQPDRAARDRYGRQLGRAIRDAVPVIRARGENHYPNALRMS